jgi:hypothetical protein
MHLRNRARISVIKSLCGRGNVKKAHGLLEIGHGNIPALASYGWRRYPLVSDSETAKVKATVP